EPIGSTSLRADDPLLPAGGEGIEPALGAQRGVVSGRRSDGAVGPSGASGGRRPFAQEQAAGHRGQLSVKNQRSQVKKSQRKSRVTRQESTIMLEVSQRL